MNLPPVLVKGRLRLFRFFSKISHLLHRPFLLPKSNSLFGNPICGQTHCVFTILCFFNLPAYTDYLFDHRYLCSCEAFEEYSRFNHIRYYLSFFIFDCIKHPLLFSLFKYYRCRRIWHKLNVPPFFAVKILRLYL